MHYILSAGLLSPPPSSAGESGAVAVGDFSQAEARRRLVEALEATVPRDKVGQTSFNHKIINCVVLVDSTGRSIWIEVGNEVISYAV